jgi:hypothetical protein
MIYRAVLFSFFAFLEAVVPSVAEAETKPQWREIYGCEGSEAIVEAFTENPSQQRFTIKNPGIRSYLGLDYLSLRFNVVSQDSGNGDPEHSGTSFRGFTAVARSFLRGSVEIGPKDIVHVFPEHGGLKVVVESEPFYWCNYDLNYGDSSGMTNMVASPIGVSCPNLEPSYSFRDASGGVDSKTSKNWFFQKCQNSNK